MINLFSYPCKIWMTSVFAGPLLLFSPIYQLTSPGANSLSMLSMDFLPIYALCIFVGAAISSPCFLIIWICYWLFVKRNWTGFHIRIGLLLISVFCCINLVFLSAQFINLSSFWTAGNLRLTAAYAVPLIFGVTVYKLDKHKANLMDHS